MGSMGTNLRKKLPIVGIALFLATSFLLGGILCFRLYEDQAELLASAFLGDAQSINAIFFRIIWWKMIACLAFGFCSLWILSFPMAMGCLLVFGGVWGLEIWLAPNYASFPQTMWAYPVAIFLLLGAAVVLSYLECCAFANVQQAFLQRNLPKTAMDVYLEAGPFLKKTAKGALGIFGISILEAAFWQTLR